ncbi:MAG: hypothetical protein AB7S68_16465 [Polyangiaceae bacterium]
MAELPVRGAAPRQTRGWMLRAEVLAAAETAVLEVLPQGKAARPQAG